MKLQARERRKKQGEGGEGRGEEVWEGGKGGAGKGQEGRKMTMPSGTREAQVPPGQSSLGR